MRRPRRPHLYMTAPGIYALSIGRDSLGWHLQIGRWVWTTEQI